MESPACRGMASCAGSMLPACIHSRGQQQVTALPCSLLTVYMVNIHSEDCRKCSQHWFHFEPHPRPLICVLHTGSGRQGQSPWATVAQYLPTVQGKRGQRGQALFGQQEAERGHCSSLMTPLSSQCLEDNIYGIKSKKQKQLVEKHVLMHAVFWMPVNFEMLICWGD